MARHRQIFPASWQWALKPFPVRASAFPPPSWRDLDHWRRGKCSRRRSNWRKTSSKWRCSVRGRARRKVSRPVSPCSSWNGSSSDCSALTRPTSCGTWRPINPARDTCWTMTRKTLPITISRVATRSSQIAFAVDKFFYHSTTIFLSFHYDFSIIPRLIFYHSTTIFLSFHYDFSIIPLRFFIISRLMFFGRSPFLRTSFFYWELWSLATLWSFPAAVNRKCLLICWFVNLSYAIRYYIEP